ncbi:PREDICTED: cytochrome P450 93A3-like [Tarenaya hassleriana]|uniref:cytochrome P450 93A3-like n=1 Tax=Tarenaya hassleriana TaxID=28532 RepID=UPI00053C8D5D|nr:PREDICTED: cytochrome P450 93A3-like [Tarenaya hassleriana]
MSSSFFQILSWDQPHDVVLTPVVVFSVLWYIRLLTKPKLPPLPPGPPGLPIVGNLPFLSPELHTYFEGLAGKYGPIFKLRLGAKLAVVVSSPETAREVLKTHDVTFANHDVPVAGRVNTYGGVDILWLPYGQEWRMLRKVCVSRMLSSATLDSSYALRRAEIRRTVRFLEDRGRSGSPVNLGEQIFMAILNVILQMLWGATVADEERESVGSEFRELISEMTEIVGIPDISDFFPVLGRFDLQGLVKRMRKPAQQLDRLFDRVINQRLRVDKRNQGDGQDFLQFLLKVREEDQSTPLTMDHVKAVLTDMVLGGIDTSSNTIQYAMAELINRPEVKKRAQQELDEVVGKDNVVEEPHITKLRYLSAVMKETLRVHPIFPLLIPHRSSQSAVVSGYTIPKDTKVFVNVWAIHRDPRSWENPLEFDPDRFLGRTGDFSGNNFSYLLITPSLLENFMSGLGSLSSDSCAYESSRGREQKKINSKPRDFTCPLDLDCDTEYVGWIPEDIDLLPYTSQEAERLENVSSEDVIKEASPTDHSTNPDTSTKYPTFTIQTKQPINNAHGKSKVEIDTKPKGI